jgi:heat shock protein HslJ
MHCGPEVTPRVLPIVIARYACEGFRFASLSQLLAGEAGTRAKASCPPPHLPPPEHKKKRPPLADALLATDWQLVEAASGETMTPVEPGDAFTLGFAGRTASGTIGCETFTARLRVKQDGSVKFRKADRVDDACASPVAPEATARLDLLLSAVGYRLDGASLVFVGGDGHDLLRYDPSLPSSLVGDWTVSSMADAEGVLQPVDPAAPLTATFTSDGRLEGSTACDAYSATYVEADGTLSIEGIAPGAAPCEEPLTTRQTAFLAALDTVASSSLADSSLQLLDAEGAVLLSLVATPPPTPSPSPTPIA